jgi:D-alanyl-D-alanine dipeptidase
MVKDELKNKHPNISEDELLSLTREYVSDINFKVPPHCSGAAVDIDVIDIQTGNYIDFGSKINEDSPISAIHSDLINKKQSENRLTLLSAMLKAGFAPLYSEWWHFSYGDQNWAAFYEEDLALYGIKEPEIAKLNK